MKKEIMVKLGIALITAVTFTLIEILVYKRDFTIEVFFWGAILSWPILLWGKMKKNKNNDFNNKK